MERDETALAALLAKNIKALRADRGWTQADLAQCIDLTPHYVALLETAQRLPTLKALLSIAKALGVTVDQLLATRSEGKSERGERIARLVAGAPEEAQLMMEGVIDAMLKGTARMLKKTRRKA